MEGHAYLHHYHHTPKDKHILKANLNVRYQTEVFFGKTNKQTKTVTSFFNIFVNRIVNKRL